MGRPSLDLPIQCSGAGRAVLHESSPVQQPLVDRAGTVSPQNVGSAVAVKIVTRTQTKTGANVSPLHEIKAPFIALIELLWPIEPGTRNPANEDLVSLIAIRRVSRLAEQPCIGRRN